MLSQYLVGALLIAVPMSALGQKKSSLKENKIRSITEYKQDMTKSSPKLKENYTLYDMKGNILEEIEYDAAGKVKTHMKYQFDDDNNKIKEIELGPDGKTLKIIEYKYNGGLRIEKNIYDGAGKLKSKRTYQYEFQK
jgi:hypothetical protein